MFITGTDTGVGKTSVSCALAAALSTSGHHVGVLKPAETGCLADPRTGERIPEDATRLRFFSGCEADLRTICPYTLRDPLAPLVAARREGIEIDPEVIDDAYRRISAANDITLVEGAGGLLVPIAADLDYAGLAARLDLTIVVVVASRLGAINHALLTMRHAGELGLRIAGYVVNFPTPGADIAADTNVEVLRELLGPPLGVVPFLGAIVADAATRRRLAEIGEQSLRIDDLLALVNGHHPHET